MYIVRTQLLAKCEGSDDLFFKFSETDYIFQVESKKVNNKFLMTVFNYIVLPFRRIIQKSLFFSCDSSFIFLFASTRYSSHICFFCIL